MLRQILTFISGIACFVVAVAISGCGETVETGKPKLIEAVKSADVETVKKLVTQVPELANARDETRMTVLSLATSQGNTEIVKVLLDKGANPDLTGGTNLETSLAYAVHNSVNEELFKALLDKSKDLETGNDSGETVLMKVAKYGNIALAKMLIAKGAKVNAQSKSAGTVLHVAVMYNNKEMVELLLEKGADLNGKDSQGKTPLALAIEKNGDPNAAKAILENAVAKGDGEIDLKAVRRQTGMADRTVVIEVLRKHGAKE